MFVLEALVLFMAHRSCEHPSSGPVLVAFLDLYRRLRHICVHCDRSDASYSPCLVRYSRPLVRSCLSCIESTVLPSKLVRNPAHGLIQISCGNTLPLASCRCWDRVRHATTFDSHCCPTIRYQACSGVFTTRLYDHHALCKDFTFVVGEANCVLSSAILVLSWLSTMLGSLSAYASLSGLLICCRLPSLCSGSGTCVTPP
jgi:hypothetical protein